MEPSGIISKRQMRPCGRMDYSVLQTSMYFGKGSAELLQPACIFNIKVVFIFYNGGKLVPHALSNSIFLTKQTSGTEVAFI